MDTSLRETASFESVWMLAGKNGTTQAVPFKITEDILDLNPDGKAETAEVVLSGNEGIAIHSHWLRQTESLGLIYPAYVFLKQPLPGFAGDPRIKDPTVNQTYANAYGLYATS